MSLGICIAALIMSCISTVIGIVALTALIGFLRSTHKVQFVPLDPGMNDHDPEEFERKLRQDEERQHI